MLNHLNENYKRRDEIIFGEYDEKKYLGGIRNFHCPRETIIGLLNEGFIDPDECQNYSPFVKDFLEYTKDLNNVEFECYAVSPKRDDYRVSIEGVTVVMHDTDFDNVSRLVETFHGADEFSFEHVQNDYYLHAWWD